MPLTWLLVSSGAGSFSPTAEDDMDASTFVDNLAEEYGRLYTNQRFPEHLLLTHEAVVRIDTLLDDLESSDEE